MQLARFPAATSKLRKWRLFVLLEYGRLLPVAFLQVNDRTVGKAIGDGRDSGYDTISNHGIVLLAINDLVKVKQDSTPDGDQTMISGYFLLLFE